MKETQPSQPDLDSSSQPTKQRHGGRRPGAGRPKGAKNALPQGSVAALKAAGLRVPSTASPEERELANVALSRMVDVMLEQVHPNSAYSVLTSSRAIREEICGPVAQKHEVAGKDGGALEVVIRDLSKEGG